MHLLSRSRVSLAVALTIGISGCSNNTSPTEPETPDTESPVITLTGDSSVSLTVGSNYSDAGATVSDNVDSSLSVTVGGDAVNTAVAGTYTITYSAVDAAGNTAQTVTRTVIVSAVDTTAPAITLNGDAEINIPLNQTYTDLGATAMDDIDGDISGQIVADLSALDTTTEGSYIATYNVSDNSGNAATQIIRTIHVLPAPLITNGDFETTLGDEWRFDAAGSNATANIAIFGGQLEVTELVPGENSWEGRVLQNSAAVLTHGEHYKLSFDIAASEDRDIIVQLGHLLDAAPWYVSILADQTIALTSTLTAHEIVFVASNEDALSTDAIFAFGNGVAADIMLDNVVLEAYEGVDVIAPVISLNGEATINLLVGDVFTDPGVSISDDTDNALVAVIGGDPVNTAVEGNYTVTYNTTDAAGNMAEQVTRDVIVSTGDTIAPVISLVGDTSISIELNGTFSDPGATATDNTDGDISSTIEADTSTVDTTVAGHYIVTYNVSDAAGNAATPVTRTVIVQAPTTNLVNNGDFEAANSLDSWRFDNSGSSATGELALAAGQLALNNFVLAGNGNTWEGRIVQNTSHVLTDGQTYTVSFDAQAPEATEIRIQVGKLLDAAPWWVSHAPSEDITITTTMASYNVQFTASNTDSYTMDFLIELGNSVAGNFVFDNITLTEVTP